jgi:hypothetical protein
LNGLRVVAGFHDVATVRDPIQQRRGHLGVAEDLARFAEGEVRRDARETAPLGAVQSSALALMSGRTIGSRRAPCPPLPDDVIGTPNVSTTAMPG